MAAVKGLMKQIEAKVELREKHINNPIHVKDLESFVFKYTTDKKKSRVNFAKVR